MKGTRPLDNNEIRLVSACFTGTFEVRNRGLFMLGVSTGGRISELLSLTIGDVYQNRRAVTDLLFDKSVVKGGEVSRAVPVNRDGRRLLISLFGIVSGTKTPSVVSLAPQIRDSPDAPARSRPFCKEHSMSLQTWATIITWR